MASSFLLPLLLLTLMLTTAVSSTTEIGVTWGQNSSEGSLTTACATGLYAKVVLEELWLLGGGLTPVVNFAGHPTFIAADIKFCQSKGVLVFLSVTGNTDLPTVDDAQNLANYLYNAFLAGSDSQYKRPFGDAIVDGISLDVKSGSGEFWDNFAAFFKNFDTTEQRAYLAASPMCPYPDYYLGTAIATGLFDFVWVEFYDNPGVCEYNPGSNSAEGMLDAWYQWTYGSNGDGKYFLGLPASNTTSPHLTGYIDPQTLYDLVIKNIENDKLYGGVMLWTRYDDMVSEYSIDLLKIINGGVQHLTNRYKQFYLKLNNIL